MAELDKVVNTTPPTSRSVGLSSLSCERESIVILLLSLTFFLTIDTPGSLLKVIAILYSVVYMN